VSGSRASLGPTRIGAPWRWNRSGRCGSLLKLLL